MGVLCSGARPSESGEDGQDASPKPKKAVSPTRRDARGEVQHRAEAGGSADARPRRGRGRAHTSSGPSCSRRRGVPVSPRRAPGHHRAPFLRTLPLVHALDPGARRPLSPGPLPRRRRRRTSNSPKESEGVPDFLASQLRVKLGTMRQPMSMTRRTVPAIPTRTPMSAEPFRCASMWKVALPANRTARTVRTFEIGPVAAPRRSHAPPPSVSRASGE